MVLLLWLQQMPCNPIYLQVLHSIPVAQRVLFSSIAALTGPAGSANYAAANAALDAAAADLQHQGKPSVCWLTVFCPCVLRPAQQPYHDLGKQPDALTLAVCLSPGQACSALTMRMWWKLSIASSMATTLCCYSCWALQPPHCDVQRQVSP